MKKPEKVFISMEECRRRVRIDFEREMGIFAALNSDPDEQTLKLVEEARKALEPYIEAGAFSLYKWEHK